MAAWLMLAKLHKNKPENYNKQTKKDSVPSFGHKRLVVLNSGPRGPPSCRINFQPESNTPEANQGLQDY